MATLNAARVLDAVAALLGVDLDEVSRLALSAAPGAGGLTLVPYLEGSARRPALLDGRAARSARLDAGPANLARAAVEGMLCGLADGLDALVAQGVTVERLLLVGGGARSAAVREIAPTVLGLPVEVPAPGEYVADGAARQAAWTLLGGTEPPAWGLARTQTVAARVVPEIRERYALARDLTVDRRD